MTTTTPLATAPAVHIPQSMPWVSWAAVLAGCVTAIAIQIALTELCIGTGLAAYEPADPASSGGAIAASTAIALLVSALIGIFAGAWVTGRMKRHGTRVEASIHGLLVWAIGAILALLLTTISLGLLTGGALSLLGKGISGAAQGLGAAVPALAASVAPNWDAIKQQVEGVVKETTNAAGQNPAANDQRFADRSRLMQLLGQSFSMEVKPMAENDRQELTSLIAGQLGISAAAARATLDQWQRVWNEGVQRYDTAKEDAKRTALEAATVAKRRTSQAAIIGFFVMMAGLAAAIVGAICGSTCVWTKAREEADLASARLTYG